MKRTHPKCVFCGRTDSPPSDEHVIEKWISALWPQGKKAKFHIHGGRFWQVLSMRPQERWGARGHFGIVVRLPCKRCNNGWMSTLSARIRPKLTEMIKGRPVTLTPVEQSVLGQWAAKTVIMFEYFRRRRNKFYTAEHCRALYKRAPIPGLSFVFLARYQGTFDAWLADHEFTVQSADDRSAPGYIVTIVIGQLVVQVCTIKWPGDEHRIGMWVPGAWDPFHVKLTFDRGIPWPPRMHLNDSVLRDFCERLGEYKHRWRRQRFIDAILRRLRAPRLRP